MEVPQHARDLDAACLSFMGYEGGAKHVRRQKAIVKDIVRQARRHRGGQGPGQLYDQKKFDTPYIRDFLISRGARGGRYRRPLVEVEAALRQHGRSCQQGLRPPS